MEATNTLIHRGPDQQGTYESVDVSLGAVRLKIIDLSAGAQRLFSNDRRTVLVFNGEIYNYLELRKELRTVSDDSAECSRRRSGTRTSAGWLWYDRVVTIGPKGVHVGGPIGPGSDPLTFAGEDGGDF